MAAKHGRPSVLKIVILCTVSWIFIDIVMLLSIDTVKWSEGEIQHPKHDHESGQKMKREIADSQFEDMNLKQDITPPLGGSANHELAFAKQFFESKKREKVGGNLLKDVAINDKFEHLPNKMIQNEEHHYPFMKKVQPQTTTEPKRRPKILQMREKFELQNREIQEENVDDPVAENERFDRKEKKSRDFDDHEYSDEELEGFSVDASIWKREQPPLFQVIRDYDVSPEQRHDDPGAFGRGVQTSTAESEAVKQGYDEAKFNQYVSDKISVQRRLKDTRPPQCKQNHYAYNKLPSVSVIVCFTEESWTPLLRTVHSVLNRTPPELLTEIILLDDASQRQYLLAPLDKYMAQFPKVRIVRMKKREGLIRARMAAIKLSKADVLVFLDSHIECSVGWLEPMLDRVWRDKRTVVQPVIDNISMDDFSYHPSDVSSRGSFKWSLEFKWESTPMDVLSRRDNETVPVPTPTIAGGLFIINKQFFHEIGQYDPGLDVWGVENLELSFKTWMCHGRLEISPCSHIGHIFRNSQPYKFPGGATKVILHNTHRIALTFLGPYLPVFYNKYPNLKEQSDGDVTSRRMILARQRCHDFDWYLKNAHSNMYRPEVRPKAGSTVVNLATGRCLDSNQHRGPILYPCHGQGGSQYFALSRRNALEQFTDCLTVYRNDRQWSVSVHKCSHTLTTWTHTKGGHLKHDESGLCLDADERSKIVLATCWNKPSQNWTFDHYS